MNHPFEKVAPLIRGHDIAFANLETPITAKPYVKPYRGLTLRAMPRAARILADAGFTVISTANNHAFDQGDLGVRETFLRLAAAGLGITGTGRTPREAWEPYVYVKRGVRVAVLAVTILRNFPAKQRSGFWTYVHPRHVHADLPRRIAAMRHRYDFFVLSLHFGVEYYQTIGRFDRTLVDKLVRAGVDVLIGHHPHVLRPVIHTGKAVLFYSLGNLLFDYEMRGSGDTAIAELELVKRGPRTSLRNVRLIPVYRSWRRVPVPATARRASRIRKVIRRITARCRTGTVLRRQGEALVVEPPR